MASRTMMLFGVVTLVALTLAAPTASARDPVEVPPVCGEFYNWCDGLVRELQEGVCAATTDRVCSA